MVATNLVPPDGGYGWVIMFAFALSNIITIPLAQGFGLLFKDRFKDLEFSSQDTALIMNTGGAISMFCGVFNGPLLKHLGYRKVSVISATLSTVGVLLTAQANSMLQYILSYGLVMSYGMGMSMSSYSLAINSFFRKKRGKAIGYAMAIGGIGPIIMPQIFSLLIYIYGVSGALTVIAGIATHTYISAVLLQPIKWHMKKELVEDLEENKELLENEKEDDKIAKPVANKHASNTTLNTEEELEVEAIYGLDPTLGGSVWSLYSKDLPRRRSMSVSSRGKFSKELKEADKQLKTQDEENHFDEIVEDEKSKEKQKPSLLRSIGDYLVDMFDLTLLQDPVYVNIMVGMSFAVFAEMNFSLLTPFIMQDYGFDTQQTATFMSIVSIADVCFRFIAPYVSDFFKQPSRIMYLWALALLILSRSCLLLSDDYYVLLGFAFFLGVAKGFRTVYWSLVIPDYVPIERLAAAAGLQSTFNSVFMWIGGSFIGYVRDAFGSFKYCIVVINFMTFVTILMWTTELLYRRLKSKQDTLNEVAGVTLTS